jgi:hypothetical protein
MSSTRETRRMWPDGDTERVRRGGGIKKERADRSPDHTQPHHTCLLRSFAGAIKPNLALGPSTLPRRSRATTPNLRAYISHACSTPPSLDGPAYLSLTRELRRAPSTPCPINVALANPTVSSNLCRFQPCCGVRWPPESQSSLCL